MAPLPGFPVTTPYGVHGDWAAGYHTGEDRSTHGATGIPVRAARAGLVVSVGEQWGPAFGLVVVLEGNPLAHPPRVLPSQRRGRERWAVRPLGRSHRVQ